MELDINESFASFEYNLSEIEAIEIKRSFKCGMVLEIWRHL